MRPSQWWAARCHPFDLLSQVLNAGNNQFFFTSDVKVDSAGNIVVADLFNYRVKVIVVLFAKWPSVSQVPLRIDRR